MGRLGLFLALILGLATSVSADWREDFAKGVEARDQGNWGEAATFIDRAIRQNPNATGEKVRIYGMKYERYIPYYYLGVALYHVGDCRGALAAFQSSWSYGNAGPPARAKMRSLERECRDRLGTTTTTIRPTTTMTRPTTTTIPPPTTTVPPSTTTVPCATTVPRTATTDPYEIRMAVVREKAETVRCVLRLVDKVTSAIHRRLESTHEAAFRRDPSLKQRYEESYRKLNDIRSLLRAAESEGDVEALEKALVRAREVLDALEQVGREVGAA